MFKRVKYLAPLVLFVGVYGCSEEPTRPDPPAPPAQISLEVFSDLGDPSNPMNLPDNEVFDIFVDDQGRTWFSTNAGMSMNDGAQPGVVFDDFAGLPNRLCRGVVELDGKLYVGTWGGGLGVYDGNPPWRAITVSDHGLVNEKVFALAADDTSVWAGTADGLSQYITRTDTTVDYSSKLGSARVVNAVMVLNDPLRGPEIWCGTQTGGIVVLRLPSMHGIWGFDPLDKRRFTVVAVGEDGTIMRYPHARRTIIDGLTATSTERWHRMNSGTRTRLLGVWGFEAANPADDEDSFRAHAVGENGAARFYNGKNWSTRSTPTINNLNAVWGSALGNVFAVGDNGTLLRYDGNLWSLRPFPSTVDLHGIWGRSGSEFYVVGENGEIWKYNGRSFRRIAVRGASANYRAVWGASSSAIFAVGADGTIVANAPSGPLGAAEDEWIPMVTPSSANLRSIWGSSSSNVHAMGEDGTAFHFDGTEWRFAGGITSPNLSVNGIWVRPDGTAFAIGSLSSHAAGSDRFYRFDGGAWQVMDAGNDQFLKAAEFTKTSSKIPENEVRDLAYDPATDLVWVALATKGIASVDVNGKVWSNLQKVDGLTSSVTHAIAVDASSTIWVGTQLGLTKWEANGTVTNFVAGSGMPDERVRAVTVDPQNRVWLAFIENGAARVLAAPK